MLNLLDEKLNEWESTGMKLFKPSTVSRHTIVKTNGGVSITITSRRNWGFTLFMIIWLFIWLNMFIGMSTVWWYAFLGVTGIADPKYQGAPVFVMTIIAISVFLIALVFLGTFGLYRFLWELAGKEFIEINREKIIISQMFGWKRTKEFAKEKIDKLITRDTKQSLFWILFQKRYRYAFELSHNGKIHRFGFLVKEQDAKEIISSIQEFILPGNN